MFEHQISQEREELKRYHKEEAEELALIYAARGIPVAKARDVAAHLIANPEQALDTLAREELGLNPDDLGSPIGAALSSFLAFAIGAGLPLIPFRSFRSSLAPATASSSPLRSPAPRSLWSAPCLACSPAGTLGLAACAWSPSAPSRPRRPTASDRCSTSPPPESRRRILLKFDATCRHPDQGEQLNWTFIAFY